MNHIADYLMPREYADNDRAMEYLRKRLDVRVAAEIQRAGVPLHFTRFTDAVHEDAGATIKDAARDIAQFYAAGGTDANAIVYAEAWVDEIVKRHAAKLGGVQ